MGKWIEEYGEQLLAGIAGIMIIMLVLTSGILSTVGERGKLPENSIGEYKDFDVFLTLCRRKKPEIVCQTEKQWYEGEEIEIEEAFIGRDGNGTHLGVEVTAITDENGTDYMDAYNRETNRVKFQKAGIYLFELKAQDEQRLCVERRIELSVDNRRESR